jgi:ankyrin repeat protein
MRHLPLLLLGLLALGLVAHATPTAKLRVFEHAGVTVVPFRFLATWMGATVAFDERTGNIALEMGDRRVSFKVGSRTAIVNGKTVWIDPAPLERDAVAYVPVRFVSEGLGARVAWDAKQNQVSITHPEFEEPLVLMRQTKPDAWATGVHLAALADSSTLIQRYLDAGETIDEPDSHGMPPLVYAVLLTKAKAARYLLEKGAAIDIPVDPRPVAPPGVAKDNATLLFYASVGGLEGLMRMLVATLATAFGAPADTLPPINPEAVTIVDALIARGADVNETGKGLATPLMGAALAGQLEIARTLLAHGADATAIGEDRVTTVHCALFGGNVELARLLLDKGADVNARDKEGRTPLAMARLLNRKDFAGLFIARGGRE